MASIKNIVSFIEENLVEFVDLRFTSLKGQEHHITIPVIQINDNLFKYGKVFDGSAISGWNPINKSDMVLIPDPTSIVIDPFYKNVTAVVRCNILDPKTMSFYSKDPRFVAQKAEQFLHDTGIADTVIFGPEPEFFLFDDIRFETSMFGSCVVINDTESTWNNNKIYNDGNHGHRPKKKGGYTSIPPIDSAQNIRSAMSLVMKKMGLIIETHHHEVAPSQHEIAVRFNTLTKKSDEIQIYKYVVHNVAERFKKTATFMPKPIMNDNGSGMHCHISLYKNSVNLFSGDEYGDLSELALFYIGGILKHAKALNAFTNPTTNSYKRLVEGYEAPVYLTYSTYNRSSAIRIPLSFNDNVDSKRIEVRFPDPAANPYLAFSALLMAGLDGIIHKIDPGDSVEKNLYTISKNETLSMSCVSSSFDEALKNLYEDHEFLMQGEVFTKDIIDTYILLCRQENKLVNIIPSPIEFEFYYSV